MSRYEAIVLAAFICAGFFCLAVMTGVEEWSKVRVAEAETAACVCAPGREGGSDER